MKIVKRSGILRIFSLLTLFFTLCCSAQDKKSDEINLTIDDCSISTRKHVILVVDQTPKTFYSRAGQDIKSVYDSLTYYLTHRNNRLGVDFDFDPELDRLDLFTFGIPGTYSSIGTPYGEIVKAGMANKSPEYLYDLISSKLVQYYSSAPRSDFESYIKGDSVIRLFKGKTSVGERLNDISGVGLSHLAGWAAVKNLRPTKPAEEYYVITVSTFKSGLGGLGDHEDQNRIREFLGEVNRDDTRTQLVLRNRDTFAKQYVERNPFTITNGDVIAKGAQIVLSSSYKTSVNINSNLQLEQEGLNSRSFRLNKVIVSMPKSEDLTLSKVYLTIRNSNDEILYSKCIAEGSSLDDLYRKSSNEYVFPPKTVALSQIPNENDELTFDYVFQTKEGTTLPYAFSVKRQIPGTEIKFVSPAESHTGLIVTLIALLAILIIGCLIWIYIKRGCRQTFEGECGSFKLRFSSTTPEHGVVDLPCWFIADDQKSANLRVKGNIEYCNRYFHAVWNRQLEVAFDFSDVPTCFTICIDGDHKKSGSDMYYPVQLGIDGSFKFNLCIYAHPGSEAFTELHRVKFRLKFRISVSWKSHFKKEFYHDVPLAGQEPIDFFVHPDLGMTWIGIDPGTTGSCVAIGRGGTITAPNIQMMSVMVGKEVNYIIPSRLAFDKKGAESKELCELIPGNDYTYGTTARAKWSGYIRQGTACYQSIKKLLGYQKDDRRLWIPLPNTDTGLSLSGVELAHLLVKGLMVDTDNYIGSLTDREISDLMPNGHPIERAVVAIPNNYTLPKILDMIESIAMTGRFREIRPIYEAEAVLFNYFSRTVKDLKPGADSIAVFDMGGATINLSVFGVQYTKKDENIHYHVETLRRIGYGVGGDSIDYALMKFIFRQVSITDEERENLQKINRVAILDHIHQLKLSMIRASQGKDVHLQMLASNDAFRGFIRQVTGKIPEGYACEFPEGAQMTPAQILDIILESGELKQFVYDPIEEAMKDLIDSFPGGDSHTINKVIFSGRSTLFPLVRNKVMDQLKKKFKNAKDCNILDDQSVKTAVAYGACWYGTFNSLITLVNDRLTSVYGFKHTSGGVAKLITVLDRNTRLVQNDVSGEYVLNSSFAGDGSMVEFYQVMGNPSAGDLFSSDKKYKINKIGDISVHINTEEIGMTVERSNKVTCSVRLETGEIKQLNAETLHRDIADENSEAYIFAVSQ